jgi:agmatinase
LLRASQTLIHEALPGLFFYYDKSMVTAHRKAVPFAGCFATDPQATRSAQIVFVDLPDDSQSSFRKGCSGAPSRIRFAYDGNCYNATTESGVDLTGAVADLGDLPSQDSWELTAKTYRECAAKLFADHKIPFFAGGDHAVTVPVIDALAVMEDPIHVVQVDAHPDLYPAYEDNPSSHGSVTSRLLEMKHVASLTQLGIRTMNPPQAEQAERHRDRLQLFPACNLPQDLPPLPHIPQGTLVYLTVDLDGFDPAFAPGVSHPVPGGLRSRQLLDFIDRGQWELVGMDVVELNPSLDVNDQTAVLAARLLHEGMGYAARQH